MNIQDLKKAFFDNAVPANGFLLSYGQLAQTSIAFFPLRILT